MLPAVIAGARVLRAAKTASGGASVAEKGALSANDSARGIMNAVSRLKTQRAGQTLQSNLLDAANSPRYEEATNDEQYAKQGGGPQVQEALQDVRRDVAKGLDALGRETGNTFDPGDAELLVKNPPRLPDFPVIIFTIALLKDVSDALVLTGIGYAVNVIFSFCLALILFIWLFSRLSGGWWKKGLMRKAFLKWGIAITLDVLPVVNLIPVTTIFILITHYDETKLVRGLNKVLESIRAGKIRI